MIKTGVNVMYKFLSIIDYQTYLKFAINEKNRKDNKPVIIEPHTLTSSHNQVTIKAEKKKRSPAKKKKKDPNAPGSVISAYTFFFRDKQATIKEQNPKAKFGDISKIVSQLWEALGETERAVYKQKNAEDKLRYGKELEAYKAGRK